MVSLLFLIVLGILLYSMYNRTYFYVFLLYSVFVIKSIITYLGIGAPPVVTYLLLFLLPFSCLPYLKRIINFSLVYIAVYILYLILKYLWSGLPFISTATFYISPFVAFLGAVALFENIKRGRVNIRPFFNNLYIILIMHILVLYLQAAVPSIGDAMKMDYYLWNGKTVMLVNEMHRFEGLYPGFLISSVNSASFLSLSTVIIVLYDLISLGRIKLKHFLIILFVIPAIILTGIRAPLFVLVLLLVIIMLRYERKYVIPVAIVMISIIFVFSSVFTGRDVTGFERIQEGLSLLSGKEQGGIADSTLGLSFLLIPFVLKNPLFGISLGEYKTALGISIGGEGLSSTDAQIVYTVCEIGIIGFMIWVLPFLKLFNKLKVDRKETGINLLLLTAFMLSIIDIGVFMLDFAFLFVVGCLILSCLSPSFYEINQSCINSLKKNRINNV